MIGSSNGVPNLVPNSETGYGLTIKELGGIV